MEYEEFEVRVIRVADKAVLLEFAAFDEQIWIPFSQIEDNGEDLEEGIRGRRLHHRMDCSAKGPVVMPGGKQTATLDDVCRWLREGVVRVEDGRVFKGGKELSQRANPRRGMETGDTRVDLYHEGKRRSCNVSALVWMQETKQPVPNGFEIHHRDEDFTNNEWNNLICVHSLDHLKFHHEADEVPF